MQHKVSPGHPGGAPVNDGRPQAALRKPCRAGSRHVWRPYGRGRMISAPTGPAVAIPPCRRRVRDAAPYGFGGGPVAIIHQSFSAARHRRRPGGPGRYSVAMIRACGVIDAGRPRRGSACHETKKGTGRGCTPGSCLLCTACRRHEPPYWGAQGGRSPPALLSPHFFGKKWGPRPGRPVPREAPRCENVEPLIRPSVRTGAPSPCGGKASGGGYPPLRARRLIRAPGSYPRAPSLAPLGQFTLSRATAGGAGAAALGGPFRLAGSRTARQGCRALLPGNRGRSQIPSFWGILGRESKPFWRSSSVGI